MLPACTDNHWTSCDPSIDGAAEEVAPQVWMADLDLLHFSLDALEQCPFLVGS